MSGYGADAHIGLIKQNSAGTPASLFVGIPITGETITHEIDEIREGDFTRYGWLEPPVGQGMQRGTGGFEFEPYPETFGHILNAFFGVASYALVESVNVYNFFAGGNQADWDTTVALPPYTLEIYRGVGSAWQIEDVQVVELNLSQETGQFLKGSLTILGRNIGVDSAHPMTYEDNVPFLWDQASLSWGGSGLGKLESFELGMANKIEGIDYLDGTTWFGATKRTDFFEATLNGVMTYDADTDPEYLPFRAGSSFPVLISYSQPTEIASGYGNAVLIDIPQFRYTTFPPQVSGPGRIQVSFTGRAIADTTSLYSLQITLTNTAGADQY